jgi:hypothetical protein
MKSFVRHIPTTARILLGLLMVTFGLNYFLPFLPQAPVPGDAGAFLGALAASGYIFAIIKPVEIIAGLMLLSNSFVPLALTLLAPIVVAIVGFHAVLAPAGIAPALVVLALELTLAYAYRHAFAPLFRAKSEPQLADERALQLSRGSAHAV